MRPVELGYIFEGQVVATDDPLEAGRVKVWCQSLDGASPEVDRLPWAEYVSPFSGFTTDFPAGPDAVETAGEAGYGFWAIPKIGASVVVFCLEGNATRRCYFGSLLQRNTPLTLPAGVNKSGPNSLARNGAFTPMEPASTFLKAQFDNNLDSSEAQTRGAFERTAGNMSRITKDPAAGYAQSPIEGETYLDPQTYCFVTPGRNALIFQDDPTTARLRLKTANGAQIILDDANERIYVSTAGGKAWIELDQDGHVHVFASESMSVRSGKDLNLVADGNVNVEAGQAVNVKARGGDIRLSTSKSLQLSATADIYATACNALHFMGENDAFVSAGNSLHLKGGKAANLQGNSTNIKGSTIKQTAGRIDLNGPDAASAADADCAIKADSPEVVPGHEPWSRPESSGPRNKNWHK